MYQGSSESVLRAGNAGEQNFKLITQWKVRSSWIVLSMPRAAREVNLSGGGHLESMPPRCFVFWPLKTLEVKNGLKGNVTSGCLALQSVEIARWVNGNMQKSILDVHGCYVFPLSQRGNYWSCWFHINFGNLKEPFKWDFKSRTGKNFGIQNGFG